MYNILCMFNNSQFYFIRESNQCHIQQTKNILQLNIKYK